MARIARDRWLLSSLPPLPPPLRDVVLKHLTLFPCQKRQEWGFCSALGCPGGRCFSLPCGAGAGGAKGRSRREPGKWVPWSGQSAPERPLWDVARVSWRLGTREREFARFTWQITSRKSLAGARA